MKTTTQPSKLEALNQAFKALYLEVDRQIVDDLRRRFDEYLAEQLENGETIRAERHFKELAIEANATLRAELERLTSDQKVLQALIEDYQKAVDGSGRHYLIAPENVKARFDEVNAENATLRAELGRLQKLIEEVKQEITEEPTIGRTVDLLFREPLEKAEAENRELTATVARLTGERDAAQREFTTACQWYWRSVDPPGQNLESIMEVFRNEARNGR